MYKFYSNGFWGYGETDNFQYGSFWHILPIIVLILAICVLGKYGKKIAAWKYEERLRYVLAFVALIVEMSYFWRILYVGNENQDQLTLMTKLPFQVCQWTCIFSAFMMMSKNRTLFCMNYFTALTFGSVALATPTVILRTGPMFYRYYQFFLEHTLPIFFVFYMIFVHKYRPYLKDIWKPFVFQLYPLLAVSIYANLHIAGANYMYLATQTEGASFANIFPQSIWIRTIIYHIVSVLIMLLVYSPYLIQNRCWKKNANKSPDCT